VALLHQQVKVSQVETHLRLITQQQVVEEQAQ
jgi:hypothetical protein